MECGRESFDVAVVGAGIAGAAVALRLGAIGRRVVSCDDPAAVAAATRASGAMLGVLGEVVPDEDEADLRLRVEAAERHRAWIEEIEAAPSGRGTFVVASARRPRDGSVARAIEQAAALHGLSCERVDPSEVPGLAPAPDRLPSEVLYLPAEGWVDAPTLLERILEVAERRHGVTRANRRISTVEHTDGRATGVRTAEGELLRCDQVVLCAGVGIPALLEASQLDGALVPALLPAKGVGLRLRWGARRLDPARFPHVLRTPNREFACGLHVVPRGPDEVYVGATNRVSRFTDVLGDATAGEVSLLLRDVTRELAVPLGSWNLADATHGFRPLPVDGLPVVGRTHLDGLSVVTGTYRNGVLLAPLLADLLADEMDADALPIGRMSPRRDIASVSPAVVLREGLAELATQLQDLDDTEWSPQLGALLSALAAMALSDGDGDRSRASATAALLRRYGRTEMVPEAVVELLEESGDS